MMFTLHKKIHLLSLTDTRVLFLLLPFCYYPIPPILDTLMRLLISGGALLCSIIVGAIHQASLACTHTHTNLNSSHNKHLVFFSLIDMNRI